MAIRQAASLLACALHYLNRASAVRAGSLQATTSPGGTFIQLREPPQPVASEMPTSAQVSQTSRAAPAISAFCKLPGAAGPH